MTGRRCVCRPASETQPWRPCLLHFGQLPSAEKRQVWRALGIKPPLSERGRRARAA